MCLGFNVLVVDDRGVPYEIEALPLTQRFGVGCNCRLMAECAEVQLEANGSVRSPEMSEHHGI